MTLPRSHKKFVAGLDIELVQQIPVQCPEYVKTNKTIQTSMGISLSVLLIKLMKNSKTPLSKELVLC